MGFNQFTPHVVVVAIGQNDNHPEDYMKENYSGKKRCIGEVIISI